MHALKKALTGNMTNCAVQVFGGIGDGGSTVPSSPRSANFRSEMNDIRPQHKKRDRHKTGPRT